jgi:hypothetical protein
LRWFRRFGGGRQQVKSPCGIVAGTLSAFWGCWEVLIPRETLPATRAACTPHEKRNEREAG